MTSDLLSRRILEGVLYPGDKVFIQLVLPSPDAIVGLLPIIGRRSRCLEERDRRKKYETSKSSKFLAKSAAESRDNGWGRIGVAKVAEYRGNFGSAGSDLGAVSERSV